MKKSWKRILPLAALLLALTGAILWWVIVVDNIAEEVVVEAGETPQASDYLIRELDIPVEFQTDLTELDLTVPGTYPVELRYYGRTYEARLVVRDTVPPEAETKDLTRFATQTPEPGDFIEGVRDVTQVDITYQTPPDMTIEGTQTVQLLLTDQGGNTAVAEAALTLIFDRTAPEIQGARDIRFYIGHEIDYLGGITVTDDLDENVTLTVDDSRVDLTVPGTYELIYAAEDACFNRASVIVTVTVIDDTQPPEILGVSPRSLYVGSTIAYRSGIVLRDDYDEAPRLTVDSSAVDLSTPGTYPLIYKAVDEAGNEAVRETTVTVHQKRSWFVEESVIDAEADRIIARIIDEDMTAREQVETIYRWIQRSYGYSGSSDKTDWKQSAYDMIVTGKGDCYSFFALSKLLFERLGIPNIDVKRVRTEEHRGDHYWNMVSVDGGETWYYYDSTPFVTVPEEFCLVTDAYLDAFSAEHWNYYNRDRESLPGTPLE